MTKSGWRIVATAVLCVACVSCGAQPRLQLRESTVLAQTCASLRARAGHRTAPIPPAGFMRDFIRQIPHDDHGPMTKDVLEHKCGLTKHK